MDVVGTRHLRQACQPLATETCCNQIPGDVYDIEPIGDVEADPDFLGCRCEDYLGPLALGQPGTFGMCREARIIAVVETAVTLSVG